VVAEPLRPVDGWLPVPRTPPTPDLARLAEHAMRDPEREAWWRARLHRVATLTM
jgi:O-succinylbenzoate synthase